MIVSIDSTGGSTTGGEELYDEPSQARRQKPTVATIGTVGASAAYMAAIATDHIVARHTSLTGSIGVLRVRRSSAGCSTSSASRSSRR